MPLQTALFYQMQQHVNVLVQIDAIPKINIFLFTTKFIDPSWIFFYFDSSLYVDLIDYA